jgi:hypothetical protein
VPEIRELEQNLDLIEETLHVARSYVRLGASPKDRAMIAVLAREIERLGGVIAESLTPTENPKRKDG